MFSFNAIVFVKNNFIVFYDFYIVPIALWLILLDHLMSKSTVHLSIAKCVMSMGITNFKTI